MKFLIIFSLAALLGISSALKLNHVEVEQKRNISANVHYGRITNGEFAQDGQFPYQAFLSIKSNGYAFSSCGGSLIGRNWVLTAAHCVVYADAVDVFLGSTVLYWFEVSVTAGRSDIIMHEGYGDIALLRIPTINYSARIQPIRLPSMSDYNSYAGYMSISIGWGQTSDVSGGSSYLKWGRNQIITNEECAGTFGSSITSGHICVATYGGISACRGDSGGPLVLENYNIIIGISSFGTASCVSGYPSVFTRVSSYLNWIKYYTGISY